MTENRFVVIEDLFKKRENGIIENHHIIVSDESIYLIKSSTNYGEYVKSLFSGIGELIGIARGGIGLLVGLASEITGDKFSKILKSYSKKSSERNLAKILKNLNGIAAKKNGITKIQFQDINELILKRGYILTGKSYIEINQNELKTKLYSKSYKTISELIKTLKSKQFKINIKTKFI